MTGFLTILGGVAGAIFSPLLCIVVATFAMLLAFIWACFSGSREARDSGFGPWWTVGSWAVLSVTLTLGVSLIIFLAQFQPFAWVLLQ